MRYNALKKMLTICKKSEFEQVLCCCCHSSGLLMFQLVDLLKQNIPIWIWRSKYFWKRNVMFILCTGIPDEILTKMKFQCSSNSHKHPRFRSITSHQKFGAKHAKYWNVPMRQTRKTKTPAVHFNDNALRPCWPKHCKHVKQKRSWSAYCNSHKFK